jgi:hypothetical protein
MWIKALLSKWKDVINLMNSKGIPVPMVRDPLTKLGSVSLSLVVISSFLVIAGIIGKWSNKWGTIDIANALQFFYASCFLYFGRNIPVLGKGASNEATQAAAPKPVPPKAPPADNPDA